MKLGQSKYQITFKDGRTYLYPKLFFLALIRMHGWDESWVKVEEIYFPDVAWAFNTKGEKNE